jgi:AcrR family transcriptional regulator
MPRQAAAKRARRLPSSETCRLLALRAGVEVFAVDGLHAATMDEVARKAGYAKPILYRYFPSKDKLFQAVVEAECEALVQHLFAAYADAVDMEPFEQYRHGIAAFVEHAQKSPHGFRLIFQTSNHRSSTVAEKIEATRKRVIDRVAENYRRGLKKNGKPHGQVADMYATMVVGLICAVVQRLLDEPKWDEKAVVDLIAGIFLHGTTHVPMTMLEHANEPRKAKARKTEAAAAAA